MSDWHVISMRHSTASNLNGLFGAWLFVDALINGDERAANIYFWTMISGAVGIAAFAAIGYVLYGPR